MQTPRQEYYLYTSQRSKDTCFSGMGTDRSLWTPLIAQQCTPFLFFLAIKTNCGYAIVGSFITQHETSSFIGETLGILKKWNPEWSVKVWLTDFR